MSRVSNKPAAFPPFYILIIVITTLLNTAFAAEKGEIRGVVRDRESGNPLPGANVWLEGTTLGTPTDLEGRYFISRVPSGTYFLIVRYVGYKEFHLGFRFLDFGEPAFDGTRSLDAAFFDEAHDILGEDVILGEKRPVSMLLVSLGYYF